ncbi:MAG: leucyl aminopeptidase [Lentisphaerae bacterium]|nr:leucyl aminopeptidase [Lentisphaerota bacterium]
MAKTDPMVFRWAAKPSPRTDARIVLVREGRLLAGESLTAEERRSIQRWLTAAQFKGKAGTAAWCQGAPGVVAAGLGAEKDFHAARWVRTWAAAGRLLAKATAVERASFEWPERAAFTRPVDELAGLAAEGLGLGGYSFDVYRDKAVARSYVFEWVGPALGRARVRAAIRRAEIILAAHREVRDIANLPANELNPLELVKRVRPLARAAGLSCKVWDMEALEKAKCGALLAVARGSRQPGCLIRLAWPGRKDKPRAPVAIVGKAVTFDSGGISIKPGKGMEWMKFDKSGGMAALATALMAARLELPAPVVVYIPAVENMPGGAAVRPGDIVTARNGKTIEVLNTDAEGRLILADALTMAAEEKPAAVVDVATLTGAAVVALGHETSAVMGTDEALTLALIHAGETVGERLWPLPVWDEYGEMVQGQFADLKNIGDGTAGPIAGAMFLKAFVPEGIPWAHVDIAGTAWVERESAHGPVGATLAPARLLTQWLANLR